MICLACRKVRPGYFCFCDFISHISLQIRSVQALLSMKLTSRPTCNRLQRLCHPPYRVCAIALALFLSDLMGSASTASAKSLINTSVGRALLLQQFSGQGDGGQARGGDVRFRANRRGPDVGFISLDPICYSCLLSPPPDPSSPPEPSGSPVAAEVSSPPSAPEPSPVVSSPAPPSLPEPTMVVPSPSENVLLLETVIEAASQVRQAPIVTPPSASIQTKSPSLRQTPAPLSLLGVGATLAFSRKLRGRIRGACGS